MKEQISPEMRVHDIDLMLIGNSNVGKTTLIQNFLFSHSKDIGHPHHYWNGYILKYKFDDKSAICIRILDTVGASQHSHYICQELLPKIKPSVIVFCYSITDRISFQDLKKRQKLISQNNIETQTKQVFGLKLDILEKQPCRRAVSYQEGKQFADSINSTFSEISAFDKQGAQQKFYDLFFLFQSQASTQYHPNVSHTKIQIKQDNFREMCSEPDQRQCECKLF